MSEERPEEPAGETTTQPVQAPRPRWGARLRGYFLAGVLVTAPIGITAYITWLFISFVDDRVKPLIPLRYNPETYLPFSIPGIGLIVAVVFLVVMGSLAAGIVGRLITHLGEGVLTHMPVVRGLYSAVKQILETILAQQSSAFREVVLVEYPRRDLWALGFITGTTRGEVQRLGRSEEMVNVFVPTTPNPTSGFLLFLPRSEVFTLSMSVEDGLKMVVSGGIVTPPDLRPPEQRNRVLMSAPGQRAG
jgi:uncharacterized membrane protein